MKKKNQYIIIACSLDGISNKEIQLLPFGKVKSKKGCFEVDALSIKSILDAFSKEKNDLVIDYEHQTLKDVIAPAAGWIKELVDKGEAGLWGKVEWTDKAATFIRNKEYQYLSPVILLNKEKRAIGLHSAALTNTPAIDGMEPIVCKLGLDEEEKEMEEFLKKLAKMLGLAETATEDEITEAITNACSKQSKEIVANKEVLELLGLKEDAKLDEVKGNIIGLKNPSGYVKAEEFKALKEKLELKERDGLVEMALKSGKVAPAQKSWAEEYALKDPVGFNAFLKDAPVVIAFKEIAGGADPKGLDISDEMQLSINKAIGISAEEFKKYSV
ncbi:phage protease [Anaerosinus gibii]|uniref:Phage protease n=1 Tax=Selenobaculum gibii TaxID=3054208 RepID=A0A9Y2AI29_9FIRM|nr:phage protease [Selenobaculum gbiensis]WIW70617.1 phage protease [Selenobaculum gbiensis]